MTDAGRAVVVTGAAGGIGSALCHRLRSDGYLVVGLDRNPSRSADEGIQVDMTDTRRLHQVGAELAKRHKLVALVHNAAEQPLGGAGEVSVEKWMEALKVNVVAADILAGATRGSLRVHEGSIVAISSVHARATTHGIAAYATTKAALEGWVRAAALDLAPEIRVNAVAPGAIDTAKLREGFGRWGVEAAVERRQLLEERTALKRIGRPDEIAAIVSFLVSKQSRFITGAVLVADGGAMVRLGSE